MEISDPVFKTLTERKKELLIGFSAVLAGAATLIAYFQSGPNATSYAQAEAAFTKWEASPHDESLYSHMKEAIQKTPSLQSKYEAAIAQKLLNTEKLDEALELAHRSINRVKSDIPFHSLYAQTSLLIEQEQYQKALEESVSLKEILATEAPNSLLFAHNLLRIACLQQQLKNRPGEKAAWEELEIHLKESPNSHLVLDNFSNKKVGLTQYITERKNTLSVH